MSWHHWIRHGCEDVVLLLKQHGIRKGSFHRLWTEQERKEYEAKQDQDITWYPPKRIIWLL